MVAGLLRRNPAQCDAEKPPEFASQLRPNSALSVLTVGSYNLNSFIVANKPTTRTATVAYMGYNKMTLSSAAASVAGSREVAEFFTPKDGPLSTVQMNFGWTEEVHY